ncbi:MAG TPA: cytochrome-c oxidase, cbb3-type subunit III [Pseudomonadales bacterium]|jgi:cytochrome c oxidase cbb3-type subunit 3|nr:cytochrome-c oxidase, cbb3-type subunit III [Cellvibrionales bacterium]HRF87336.1 cytochrome-c oxidase, cbb3-type subunit III [Pseudomonadales bacterium]HRG49875.1 cytochrome-c oxidase, cbb3-type subunit III [Pseudomonadales bacterium]
MSSFWSAWIIILTTIVLVGLVWVLFGNRTRSGNPDSTTGHVYDGIEEYDNPMPAWWFYMFVLSIIFGVAYLIFYPGMGNYKGALGWTQNTEWQQENAKMDEKINAALAPYANMSIEDLAKDEKAMRIGQRLFASNCALCHGADAGGTKGFPNLRDSDWLYGGTPEKIVETIALGRKGAMPPWKSVLTETQMDDVTAWITTKEANKKSAAGAQVFATYCAVCHNPDAKGNQAMGAPDLTDDVWLYGGEIGDIKFTIHNGRNGQMPAHEHLLIPEKIHLLAAFVYSLSATNQEGTSQTAQQ